MTTFAEFIIFCLLGAVVYRGLRFVQRRIERWLLARLNSGGSRPGKPVIDITDFKK